MNNTHHTPSPWNSCYKNHDNGENYFAIIGTPNGLEDNLPHKGAFICKVTGKRERMEANARLIAAAPDLLSALIELERVESSPHSETVRYLARENAREAIRKAKGEA